MISSQNPGGDILSTDDLERMLGNYGCTKTGPCTRTSCRWETPKGRGFSAPNPVNVRTVPASQQDFLMDILQNEDLMGPPPWMNEG